VDRGQKAADEHYQQVDFHVSLRCAIAALASAMQKASGQKGVPAFAMTVVR
jgi:hypothetical protein